MFRGYAPLFLLWIGGLAAAAIVAFSKGQEDLKSDRSRQLTQVAQLTTSLRIAFDNFAERSASDLARIIEVEITQDQIGNWLMESPFQSVALVDQEVNGTWKVSWARSKDAAAATDLYQGWLSKLPLEKITGEFVSWNRIEIPGQRPALILGVQLRLKTANSEKTQVALGQLPLDHLATLTDPLKSEGTEIFLVDSAGYSLTFPNPQYVGSYMDVHPLVSAAVKAQGISDAGDFRNLTGEPTVGGFERVKNSNVYVIANLPATARAVYVYRQLSESGFVILGLLILISIPMVLMAQSSREKLEQLRHTLATVDNSAPPTKSDTKAVSAEAVDTAKKEIFERFANAVFQQLKGPVYGAIGKVSRLNTLATNEQAKEVITALEGELRRAKYFVEGLGRSLKANERAGMEVNLSKVLETELAKNAENFQKKNLDVEFTPASNLVAKSHADDVHKIFRVLLKRALNLDDNQQQKTKRKLMIRMEGHGPIVRTTFLFQGHRVGDGQIEKIFDIRNADDLDLSEARGLAVSWNGQLQAEDSMAGLRFSVELPFAPGYEVIKTGVTATGITIAKEPKPNTQPAGVTATGLAASKGPSQEALNAVAKQLELKKVDETLNKVLPPAPGAVIPPDVSVVEDLTMTKSKTDSKNDAKDIVIRKPRVRIE